MLDLELTPSEDHGFMDIAPCDIMDEDGEIKIPLQGGEHLSGYDIVGSHIGLPFMIAELSVFSLVSGLFSKKISKHSWLAIPAVLLAILAGRLSFLGLVYIFEGVSTLSVNLIWGQILSSYPGILLQLILVPAIIILLNKILNREEK